LVHWRTVLARELLRDDNILIFHRDGDVVLDPRRGESRVGD
jgi:hypothetical protein